MYEINIFVLLTITSYICSELIIKVIKYTFPKVHVSQTTYIICMSLIMGYIGGNIGAIYEYSNKHYENIVELSMLSLNSIIFTPILLFILRTLYYSKINYNTSPKIDTSITHNSKFSDLLDPNSKKFKEDLYHNEQINSMTMSLDEAFWVDQPIPKHMFR